MLENYPFLLVTKLYIPRLRSSHVRRVALLAALDGGIERKLILVAAAAGFGKTTLLADWVNPRPEGVGWFSLDDGDNDPIRFLSYLTASIQLHRPQVGQELLTALQSPHPPTLENALPSLVNQLAVNPERLLLVLDDYHVIENQAVHNALAFLLEHLPPQVTFIVLTRSDPPLPLARLRAKNELLELRAAVLRFSAVETEQFLNQMMQLALPAGAIEALDGRTEGWIAGLQLAAIAMQSLPGDRQAFIHHFTGSHRFVLDYLMEEVLGHQPETVRRFLLQTSFLRRLNKDLCRAITAEANSQVMIEYLERHNLFLIPLDQSRYWYRYHHLFADLLQAHFRAEMPDQLQTLYRQAADWHEQQGLPEEAVLYALTSADFEQAARLITGPAARVMQRGEIFTLLEWYRAFPPDFVACHPRLALQFGMAFALNGRWPEAETLLNYVEQDNTLQPEETLLLAYLVASYHQDINRLATLTQQITTKPNLDRATKLTLGLVISLKGDLRTACQFIAESQAASEREGDSWLALTALFHQCLFHVYLGNLRHAHNLCQQALQRAHALGGPALLMANFAHVSLGRIFIEWNEPEKAANHLGQAIQHSERSGLSTGMVSSSTMMLAEVQQAQGHLETANETAKTALVYAERFDPPPEVVWLKTYQARLWLVQGNVPAATVWLHAAQNHSSPISLFYPNNIQKVTQAHTLLAQRKPEQAIALLTQLLSEPADLLTVEALALLALARQAQGDINHALLALGQALALAEPENRVRIFLNLGQPMAKLLARFVETQPEHTYAHTLLSVFPVTLTAVPFPEPLSERELEVVRLIVAGYSNEEIAQSLTLATSTVKWYINTLYSKLHVKTRSQAIARARELNLF